MCMAKDLGSSYPGRQEFERGQISSKRVLKINVFHLLVVSILI